MPGARCRPCHRRGQAWTNASTSANRRIGRERAARHPPLRPWRSQSGMRMPSRRWTGPASRARRGATARRRPGHGRPDAAARRPPHRSTGGEARRRRHGQQSLLPIAHEAGLHEQLDVVVGIGARDVKAGRPALRTVSQQVLDETEAHVAGVVPADGVELDHGPFVTWCLALDAQQARDVAVGSNTYSTSCGRNAPSGRRNRLNIPIGCADTGSPSERVDRRRLARRDSSPSAARSVSRAARTLPLRVAIASSSGRPRPARGCGRRPSPRPDRHVGGHRREQPVEARLAGELGVERGRHHVPLPDRDDPPIVEPGEDVHVGADRSMIGARMNTRAPASRRGSAPGARPRTSRADGRTRSARRSCRAAAGSAPRHR